MKPMTQKNMTILSMCAIVLASVVVNEVIIRNSNNEQDRAVASFGERFEPNQIKWEHDLAKTVSKEINAKTLLGKKPNLQDRLLFEVFEGHYEAKLEQGKIQKISLLENQTPLNVTTEDFMKDYAVAMRSFEAYQVKQIDSKSESVQLKDKAGAEVGLLKIQRDDKGRVLTIEIQ
jgi:hypothetical protein